MLDELRIIKDGILLKKRGYLLCLILFFAFFTFYYVFSPYLIREAITSKVSFREIQASFNFVIALSILFSSFFIHRINGLNAILACSAAITTAIILLLLIPNEAIRVLLIFAVGVFYGIGELAFFSYFWRITALEERGRIAGFVALIALPLYFLIGFGLTETLDLFGTAMLSVILILITLGTTLFRPKMEKLTTKKKIEGNTFEKRFIVFYSIPWIVFSIINATLAVNISLNTSQQVTSYFYLTLLALQLIAALLGALIGGLVADLFGRKLPLAFSLTLYGISSVLAGLVNNSIAYYFSYIANGLSWGILLMMYSFVVWGDLANEKNYFKMYGIGLITFFSATGVGLLLPVSEIPLVISSLASCMLIFISNIPVILAPELLPSDFREKMKLKLHIKTVRKIEKQNQG
jgi:MFS family permease